VVGNTGSGKSTLARRIAEVIGAPYVELDAIHHLPDWVPIDTGTFRAEAARIAAGVQWVVDGNYREVVVDGPIWQRADIVVWLRLPRRTVMRQIVGRTVRRAVTRQVLWNGNREPLSNFTRWDPEQNVIRWAWTRHAKYDERYGAAMADPRFGHLRFVVLRSHAAAERWLRDLR